MSANTDLVRAAAPNFSTTLANSMLVGDTSLTLQSATGLSTTTAITLVIDATDPVSGAATPSLKEVVTGTLSGTTVSNLLRGQDGTTAQGHASGATVVMWITANLWNDWQTSYLTEHTQLGAHVMTSPKIITGINDTNGNKVLGITATGSAVNQLNIADSATGNAPVISATGTDNNIGLTFTAKGTGAVTGVVEAMKNPYKFRVHLGTAQTISSNTFTLVPFDTKDFDTSSNVDIVTHKGRFTAPIAGFYQFNSSVENNSGSAARNMVAFYKNGAEYSRGTDAQTSAQAVGGASVSDLIQLAANDYVEALFFTSGSNIAGTNNDSASVTYFSGFLVSAT